jgi:hypothetical protein
MEETAPGAQAAGAQSIRKEHGMIRNLKTLGIALAAVFALGAVIASAASAQQAFLTGDGPVSQLTGKDIGAAAANRLTAVGTFTHCEESSYVGTAENGKPFEHATTIKVVPSYKKCKSTALGVTTDVEMHGCYYLLHLKETTSTPADTYGVLATLICEGTNRPVVTVTGGGLGTCTITITNPNGAGYPGLDVLDTTNGEIDLKGTATGILVSATGGLCPETGENKPSSLDAEITITGDNEAGTATAIGISQLGQTTSTP